MDRGQIAGAFLTLLSWPLYAAGGVSNHLSLQGYSGLTSIPDARVLPEGNLSLQFNNDLESSAPVRDRDLEIRNYLFNVGVWDRFELGGRISSNTRDGGSRGDLSASAKLNLYENGGFRLAIGAADFAGDAQKLRANYATGTYLWRYSEFTVGYGSGPDRLKGLFGGLRFRVFPKLVVSAEYDGLESHLGAHTSIRLSDRATLTAQTKLSSFESQRLSAGVGLDIDLGESSIPIARNSERAAGVKSVSGEDVELSEASVDTTKSPDNSLVAVRKKVLEQDLVEHRYGVNVRRFNGVASGTQTVKWESGWLGGLGGGLLERNHYRFEMRVEGALRMIVASDFGTFDYSLAARPTARLQGPLGLGGYVSQDVPLIRTDDARPGGVYSHLNHDSGLHQAAVQWGFHPLPGLIGLLTAGRTEVDEVPYDIQHADWAVHSPSGRHQLRLAAAEFSPHDGLNFQSRSTAVASYRYWWSPKNLSVRVGYGEFFYEDSGATLDIQRFFGDVSLGLFYRRRQDGEQLGGFQVSLPLLASAPFSWKSVKVYGDPRFRHQLGTRIQGPGGQNVISRGFMLEPLPQYNLLDDVLDSDRAIPDYPYTAEQIN